VAVRGHLYAGVAGFSYPAWKGEFYPPDARPAEFLRHYAERLPSVELVGVFYRLPAEEVFQRWAAQTPPDFRFGVKMHRRLAVGGDVQLAGTFSERVAALGERLGAVRVQLAETRTRDEGFLRLLLGSLDPSLRLAFELPHESWDHAAVDDLLREAGATRVNTLDGEAPFRYLRLREPPYEEDALQALARQLRPLLDGGIDVYCYFKHEDEPRGARYAERLLELTASGAGPGPPPARPSG
jgi:uncharacterized protein YecE (DUF72 family)